MLRSPQNTQIPTRPGLTYCGPNLVLTMGSTLLRSYAVQSQADQTRTAAVQLEAREPLAASLSQPVLGVEHGLTYRALDVIILPLL
jgi:hypothetical protein